MTTLVSFSKDVDFIQSRFLEKKHSDLLVYWKHLRGIISSFFYIYWTFDNKPVTFADYVDKYDFVSFSKEIKQMGSVDPIKLTDEILQSEIKKMISNFYFMKEKMEEGERREEYMKQQATKDDYRYGIVLVFAYEDEFSEHMLNVHSPETYLELCPSDHISSFVVKLFKQAIDSEHQLSPNHDRLFIATKVNKTEFDQVVNAIGKYYLEHDWNLPGAFSKNVNYKGHVYQVILIPGNLTMPDTSKMDEKIRKKAFLKWDRHKRKKTT